jgi:hypothetical protein
MAQPQPCAGNCCCCCGAHCCILPIVWHWLWWVTCPVLPWMLADPYQYAMRRWLNDFNLGAWHYGYYVGCPSR